MQNYPLNAILANSTVRQRMKRWPLYCGVSVLSVGLLGARTPLSAATDGEIKSAIKEVFPYVPAQVQATNNKADAAAEVVAMKPFLVFGQRLSREQREVIETYSKKINDERFSITDGGTLLEKDLGKARVKIGAWYFGAGFKFLQISW